MEIMANGDEINNNDVIDWDEDWDEDIQNWATEFSSEMEITCKGDGHSFNDEIDDKSFPSETEIMSKQDEKNTNGEIDWDGICDEDWDRWATEFLSEMDENPTRKDSNVQGFSFGLWNHF